MSKMGNQEEAQQASRHDRAAAMTVEALMFSLRGGVAVLAQLKTQYRLAELGDKQMREVAVRAQKFKPEIAAAWKPEDVEVLITLWGKLRRAEDISRTDRG
jgi:hypothetical protein